MSSIIIEEINFDKARKEIRKNKDKEIIFSSQNDETNKKILEKEAISVLLLKVKARKDRQKQRDSGFDSVMAKIAKKKGITIGIDYEELVNSQEREKMEILARIRQNVKICNKEKLKMKFIIPPAKQISKQDLMALGLVLGMPTWMVA